MKLCILHLGNKINLKAVDNEGLTPLHCAVYVNAMDVVQILLKHGGKICVCINKIYTKIGTKSFKLCLYQLVKIILCLISKQYFIFVFTISNCLEILDI